MSKLLALKANQDPENGVNKKGIAQLHQTAGSSGKLFLLKVQCSRINIIYFFIFFGTLNFTPRLMNSLFQLSYFTEFLRDFESISCNSSSDISFWSPRALISK